jgi:hypothetical protein
MIISLSQKEKQIKLSGGFSPLLISSNILRTYEAGCLLASPVFSSNSNGIESSVSGEVNSKESSFQPSPAIFMSKLNYRRLKNDKLL